MTLAVPLVGVNLNKCLVQKLCTDDETKSEPLATGRVGSARWVRKKQRLFVQGEEYLLTRGGLIRVRHEGYLETSLILNFDSYSRSHLSNPP